MNRAISWLCKTCLKFPVDKFLIKKISGQENIPKGNFILAANHQSHLDHIATGYVCVPKKYHYIGQTDRYRGFDRFLLNILYSFAGVIRVHRENSESKKETIEKSIEVIKKGASLVIYPEGTRTRNGKMGEGKPGIAKIFIKTGVPILPVGIKGTFELMPPGTGFPKIKKEVKINIGKPLFFEKELIRAKKIPEDSIEYQEILEKITKRIMSEIAFLVENA
jgi:1-acyl-sn-glycerol-3-phosphate acyltransferase